VGACPILQTERLVLRPFLDSDLDAYLAVLRSPQVRASLRLPDTVGRAEAWSQLALWRGMWELRGCGQWALEDKASGAFVGRAGLHLPERPDWPGVEVGWTLHPAWWGRGLATEAGAAAVRYGVDVRGDEVLWSVILPDNAASQRVAGRLGFRLVDERVLSHHPPEPHGIWRLEASAWRAGGGAPSRP
jgi:RimJ/RimL family protein N-acetyltransferase